MPGAAILYVVSAVLEAGGVLLTVHDIHKARHRLLEYLALPRQVYAPDAGGGARAFNAVVLTAEAKPLEQRVGDLEQWKQRDLPRELAERDVELSTRLERRLRGDLEAVHKSVADQYAGMRAYIEGGKQSTWRAYRGLIALGFGLVVGLCGNLVALG